MIQNQREALVDLLNLSLFVDAHVSLSEDAALQSALDKIGWEGSKPREIFSYASVSRARKASESPETMAEYIASRTSVLADPAMQTTAVEIIQSVLAGDGVSKEESAFLQQIKAALPRS
jgi:hypothetical protein